MATNFCGTTTARVEFKKGLCRLEMPNVFTPNNDGLNDAFEVKFPDFIKTFRMRIFDRWGKIIFDTTNPLQGWDGKYKGLNQDTGNYTWLITLTDLHGKTENASGSVLLIR
jgi:gliding motility-associated-like protein